MQRSVLAFDFGGTTIKYGVVDADYKVAEEGSFATERDNLAKLLDNITSVVKATSEPVDGIACALPGEIDSDTGMIGEPGAISCLRNQPLGKILTERFQVPVRIENDAKCSAIAEHELGAAKDVSNVVFIVLGTGIGGAILNDGHFLTSTRNYSGEFGYMILDPQTAWDDLHGSVVATVNQIHQQYPAYREKTGQELFDLYGHDQTVTPILDRFYELLGSAIYSLQMIVDPDLFVIGGGISQRSDLVINIENKLNALHSRGPLPYFPHIKTAYYGNQANIIGASYNLRHQGRIS